MNNPLISIVIPSYNCAAYITETINSVLNQTYQEWELIVVDDGSTDNSVKIVEEFTRKDSRIVSLKQTNKGQGAARNSGIRHAKGELIAFLDADDSWAENKLELQIREKKRTGAHFIYSLGYHMLEDENNIIVPYEWHTGQYTGLDFFKILINSNAVNTDTVLLDKKIFDEIGFFDEAKIVRGSEDFDMWMRVAYKNNYTIYGMNERLVTYKLRSLGEHAQTARQYCGKLYVYDKYSANNHGLKLEILKQYRYFSRELINVLFQSNQWNEISPIVSRLKNFDKTGITSNLQSIILKFFSIKTFISINNNFIYRISYRLENLHYKVFSLLSNK